MLYDSRNMFAEENYLNDIRTLYGEKEGHLDINVLSQGYIGGGQFVIEINGNELDIRVNANKHWRGINLVALNVRTIQVHVS